MILLGFVLLCVQVRAVDDSDYEEELTEAEYELKRMLSYVTPIMAILRKDERIKRSVLVRKARASTRSDSYGYGDDGYYEEEKYYYPSCCKEKTDYLGLISLISLGLLGLFLVALLSTTTTAAGRRKRSDDEEGNDVDEDDPSMYLNIAFFFPFTKSIISDNGKL